VGRSCGAGMAAFSWIYDTGSTSLEVSAVVRNRARLQAANPITLQALSTRTRVLAGASGCVTCPPSGTKRLQDCVTND
jgi:hypothetical protein